MYKIKLKKNPTLAKNLDMFLNIAYSWFYKTTKYVLINLVYINYMLS
jgi:predicted neuraminidase